MSWVEYCGSFIRNMQVSARMYLLSGDPGEGERGRGRGRRERGRERGKERGEGEREGEREGEGGIACAVCV